MSRGRFFCEHCGAQVPLEVDACPQCHRPFGDVVCPRCQHSGPSPTFGNGCPSCGYLAAPAKGQAAPKGRSWFVPTMIVLLVLLAAAAALALAVRR